MDISRIRSSQIDNFWSKVIKLDNGCWEWVGSLGRSGYGHVTINRQQYTVHRLSFALIKDDPGNLFVLHKCDNKRCVNPDHLFLGTHQDNMDDKLSKGRQPRGSIHGRAKLVEKDVIEIRKLNKSGYTHKEISNMYNVSVSTIAAIICGYNWRHLK